MSFFNPSLSDSLYLLQPHCYSFTAWKDYPVIAGFTDRFYEDGDAFNGRTVLFPHQIHSTIIACVENDEQKEHVRRSEGCDGIITSQKNLMIGVRSADCVPLFFLNRSLSVIGLIHAGWRGIADGIVEEACHTLYENYTCRAEDLLVGIGPAIRSCCFEVREEVAASFEGFVRHKAGRLYVDLIASIKHVLLRAGIFEKNITDASVCTCCEIETFYSYRKEKEKAGRILSLLMVEL